MKTAKASLILLLSIVVSVYGINPSFAESTQTWSEISELDKEHDGDHYNPQYDLEYLSLATWSSDPDLIFFYMYFKSVPSVNMFNDGLDSYGAITIDTDLDNKGDLYLFSPNSNLTPDRSPTIGDVFDSVNKRILSCETKWFTNINEGKNWIGIAVSKTCIKLPETFLVMASARYNTKSNLNSYDFAPWPPMRISLTGARGSATVSPSFGSTHILPQNISNSAKDSLNFDSTPVSLSTLTNTILPSVVTVKCSSGTGTGWSAESSLSGALISEGYKTLIITNHHVIEDCLSTKNVSLLLSNGTTVSGKIVSWNRNSDVAGVATTTFIPALQWIGSSPRQGWWIGVIGSPLGQSNVLTTGIISSINTVTKQFTITAAINPGNSGGPVFDNTGRVLGLATSKAILSNGQLAEGFGNAHGVPLLCGSIISCLIESDPWNAKAKFLPDRPNESSSLNTNSGNSVGKVTVFKVIKCSKGNIVKKIKAVKPKCPTGYKIKR